MKDKTGKLIIKVIYISFAVIICVFSSIVLFNTAKGDHIVNLTDTALNNKNYSEILSLFGGIYYEEPSVKGESKEADLMISPTYTEETIIYSQLNDKDVLETHYYHKFLKSYTVFIFNPSFNTITINSKKNDAGLKFVTDKLDDNGNPVTYTYPFVISSKVNTTKTFDQAESPYDHALNYKRDLIEDSKKYGFYNFVLTSNTIDAIEDATGGNIVSFNVTNNKGENVYEEDLTFAFDFNETLYNADQGGVIEKVYNDYIPYYDSYKINSKKYVADNYNAEYDKKDLYNEKTETFNKNVSTFIDDVKSGTKYDSNLKISKSEKEIITNSVIAIAVWRTIGIEALVLVVIAVIYILLFHFQQLRDFIFRNDKRTPIRPKIQNVEPNKDQKAKFNYNQSGNNTVIDAKPVEIKEEPKEQEAPVEEAKENNEE